MVDQGDTGATGDSEAGTGSGVPGSEPWERHEAAVPLADAGAQILPARGTFRPQQAGPAAVARWTEAPGTAAMGARAAPMTGSRPAGHGVARGGRRSWLYAGRSVVAVSAVLTVVVFGMEWNIEHRADRGLAAHAVAAINLNDPHIMTAGRPATSAAGAGPGAAPSRPAAAAAAAPVKLYPPENILLLGSDTRAGANAATGANSTTTGVANSDTVMVAHISGDRQHVTVLSLPRDTMIPAPTCHLWDAATGKYSQQLQPIHPGERFHLSSTFSVGGPRCVVTAVQALTGLGINRMIGIDFIGFQAMVNALGGVTVNICRPVVDTEIGTVVPRAGTQKIFGIQALNLVRARHVLGDPSSDLSRIRRQQVVLSAILRQVSQAGTLLNPSTLDAFLQAFTSNTFTDNVTVSDLVTLAGSLGSLDPGHVTFYTMPTVADPTVAGALDPDPTKAPAMFSALVNDQPLPGETAPMPTPATPPPAVANPRVTAAPAQSAPPKVPPATPPTTLRAADLASVNAGTSSCA